MKKNKLFTLLFCAAACATVAFADTGAAQSAVALAANNTASIESVCQAVAAAVKNDTMAPSALLQSVISSRASWSAAQVEALYKSVLFASPALSASFMDDVTAFEDAGKPKTVSADAAEGVKLLAVLYGAEIPGVNADTVLASVVASAMGPTSVMSVSSLRDVTAQGAQRKARPVKPTPPVVSSEN